MELLAKCFHNSAIKPLCDVIVELMKEDEGLCETFLGQCMEEDQANYLIEIMLECSDMSARNEVAKVVKYVVERMKQRERERLFEVEKVTNTDEKGVTYTVEQPASILSRFIMKCLSLLNT
jgi:hypothetical protein